MNPENVAKELFKEGRIPANGNPFWGTIDPFEQAVNDAASALVAPTPPWISAFLADKAARIGFLVYPTQELVDIGAEWSARPPALRHQRGDVLYQHFERFWLFYLAVLLGPLEGLPVDEELVEYLGRPKGLLWSTFLQFLTVGSERLPDRIVFQASELMARADDHEARRQEFRSRRENGRGDAGLKMGINRRYFVVIARDNLPDLEDIPDTGCYYVRDNVPLVWLCDADWDAPAGQTRDDDGYMGRLKVEYPFGLFTFIFGKIYLDTFNMHHEWLKVNRHRQTRVAITVTKGFFRPDGSVAEKHYSGPFTREMHISRQAKWPIPLPAPHKPNPAGLYASNPATTTSPQAADTHEVAWAKESETDEIAWSHHPDAPNYDPDAPQASANEISSNLMAMDDLMAIFDRQHDSFLPRPPSAQEETAAVGTVAHARVMTNRQVSTNALQYGAVPSSNPPRRLESEAVAGDESHGTAQGDAR